MGKTIGKAKFCIILKAVFFFSLFLLVSCFQIDLNMNSNYNKAKNSVTSVNKKSFVFQSVMTGLPKSQKKPATKFVGMLTYEEIENLKVGQINEEEYFGFEEVLVKFFNTLDAEVEFKTKEQLFMNLRRKIELVNSKINLGIKEDKEYISQKNSEIKIKQPVFEDESDRSFYKEQIELFESDKDLKKFLEKKNKYLFIEENFIKEQKQWNPVIKLIFQLNMARFHLDFIEITQQITKNIIIAIIDYVINLEATKKTEQKLTSEINNLSEQKSKIELEIKKEKENIQLKLQEKDKLNEETYKKIEKISQKIVEKKVSLEELKQKNSQILRLDVKKIIDFLASFFDPILHYSIKSDYVFQNEINLRVNNQLAFSKFFEFFTKNLKKKLKKYNLESPFSIMGEKKRIIIEKYFIPII
ncbi:hypothetical protein [Mesomycoplasma flocculare]|uniref:hypothetical protein n=1 Tax=Mesomycoplasma flocculare TaxID=2128 RepID=UPI001C692123|nr:hypothetical protein [Mesomycoplasma flocculare]